MRCFFMALAAVSLIGPTANSDQVRTTQTQTQTNVDWALVRGAVALSVIREITTSNGRRAGGKQGASFLSSAVMISPTVGLTAAHSLDHIVDAFVIEDFLVKHQ